MNLFEIFTLKLRKGEVSGFGMIWGVGVDVDLLLDYLQMADDKGLVAFSLGIRGVRTLWKSTS